jgi:hypothetical protein
MRRYDLLDVINILVISPVLLAALRLAVAVLLKIPLSAPLIAHLVPARSALFLAKCEIRLLSRRRHLEPGS